MKGYLCLPTKQLPGTFFGNTTKPDSTITYTADEWREFVAGVRRGDFDDIG
jgi:hypothetical protein